MAMSSPARVTLRLTSTGVVLARAELADGVFRRMLGLLGRDRLTDGDGLILEPCSSIHTCFMRFAIDVLFVDRCGRVLRVVERLRPFRFAWGGAGARRTIELPAGTIGRFGVLVGATVEAETSGA